MMMLQEMRNQQIFGKRHECPNQGLAICQNQKIGGQHEILDRVDLIQKFFIGFENEIYHQNEVM
jgi:hypothetical protein